MNTDSKAILALFLAVTVLPLSVVSFVKLTWFPEEPPPPNPAVTKTIDKVVETGVKTYTVIDTIYNGIKMGESAIEKTKAIIPNVVIMVVE